jgi:hypothetical protein
MVQYPLSGLAVPDSRNKTNGKPLADVEIIDFG